MEWEVACAPVASHNYFIGMKLDQTPRIRRLKSTSAAGVERPVQPMDSREAVRLRWDEIFKYLVTQCQRLSVEIMDVLPDVMDLYYDKKDEFLEQLRQAVGPEQFTFERLKPMLDAKSYNEDEAFMTGDGEGDSKKFLLRIKQPKVVFLQLLFPAHAAELRSLVKGSVDEVIESSEPFDYSSPYIEAMRLYPERINEIRQTAARNKQVMFSSALDRLRSLGRNANPDTIENLAEVTLLFPDVRNEIMGEFRPVLDQIQLRLPREQSWGQTLRMARALEILYNGATLQSDGAFSIDFPKPAHQPVPLPTRPGV